MKKMRKNVKHGMGPAKRIRGKTSPKSVLVEYPFLCLKNENIMEGLFLQPEGIHLHIYLYTYRGRNQECCNNRQLFLHTIQTIKKAFEVFIGIVNLYNQNN